MPDPDGIPLEHSIPAVEILIVEGVGEREAKVQRRSGCEPEVWKRVKQTASARLSRSQSVARVAPAALRGLVMVLCMGEIGLRNGEVCGALRAGVEPRRADAGVLAIGWALSALRLRVAVIQEQARA